MAHPQDEAQHLSLTDPETFWGHQAEQLHWHKKPSAVLKRTTKNLKSGTSHNHWEWFPDGEISTCYNCIDRHVLAGRGDQPAILYDSPVTNTKQRLTYKQLLTEVETFAGVLREEGVKKGDVVLVYSQFTRLRLSPLFTEPATDIFVYTVPMVPATLIGILAVNRLGAIHAVVFGGFASTALAQRIEASRPVAILTASCGIEGNKGPVSYRAYIEEAISISSFKPPKTIIWQREQLVWRPIKKTEGERDWHKLVKSARSRNVKAECVPVRSADPIYIIYTSGTTGLPKGVVRDTGGHAVGLHMSISYLFGIHGPGDVVSQLLAHRSRVHRQNVLTGPE